MTEIESGKTEIENDAGSAHGMTAAVLARVQG